MICSAKPILTEDLYIMQKEEFLNNMLYVRYVHLTEAKSIHKRHTHLLFRVDVK
jgi:hypothetical protein